MKIYALDNFMSFFSQTVILHIRVCDVVVGLVCGLERFIWEASENIWSIERELFRIPLQTLLTLHKRCYFNFRSSVKTGSAAVS